MTVQYWAQDYFDNGILHPIDDFFDKWDAKSDFFPNVVEQMRSKPGQPVLYLPQTSIPYFLFYRADWLDGGEAQAARRPTTSSSPPRRRSRKPPDRYGFAMRGQTLFGDPGRSCRSGRSAGVKFVDEKGNVDFDSPAAIARHREVGRACTPRTSRRSRPR